MLCSGACGLSGWVDWNQTWCSLFEQSLLNFVDLFSLPKKPAEILATHVHTVHAPYVDCRRFVGVSSYF